MLLAYLVTYCVTAGTDELIVEMEFGAEIAYKSVYVAPLINYSASASASWTAVGGRTTKSPPD